MTTQKKKKKDDDVIIVFNNGDVGYISNEDAVANGFTITSLKDKRKVKILRLLLEQNGIGVVGDADAAKNNEGKFITREMLI